VPALPARANLSQRFENERDVPVCHLKFRREQGYFLGALYVYYGLSLPVFLALIAWLSSLRAWSEYLIVFPALALYAPLIPFIYRYARIIWIHFDRLFDPE
jgi:hypothetical protein